MSSPGGLTIATFKRTASAPPQPAVAPTVTTAGTEAPGPSALGRLREFWFGQADLAPLALLRIAYGLLLIVWLLQLWPDLASFFTDEGMMPRSELAASYPGLFTLLSLVGQWWQVALFWAGAMAVAIMLTAGYRTRLACALAFVAVLSFENRNPLMLDSSDFVFKLVPLWLTFTAAGQVHSVDAYLRKARGDQVSERGPAFPIRLLEFQIAWIYFATALEKWAGSTWLDGTAVGYVFQLSHTFARPFAAPLASSPELVRAFTWETLAVELAFLPLVFLPGPGRMLAVFATASLQLGILITLNVGNFPLIMLAVLVLFLPATWAARILEPSSAVVRHVLPDVLRRLPAGNPSAARWQGRRLVMGYSALALMAVAGFSLALPARFSSFAPSGQVRDTLVFAGLDQAWNMFSPNPSRTDWVIRAPGQLSDGAAYDVLPSSWGPGYSRWMKILDRLTSRGYGSFLQEFGRSVCRLHNNHLAQGGTALDGFQLYFLSRRVTLPDTGDRAMTEELLWDHHCF
jgi:hypothetical protein